MRDFHFELNKTRSSSLGDDGAKGEGLGARFQRKLKTLCSEVDWEIYGEVSTEAG